MGSFKGNIAAGIAAVVFEFRPAELFCSVENDKTKEVICVSFICQIFISDGICTAIPCWNSKSRFWDRFCGGQKKKAGCHCDCR